MKKFIFITVLIFNCIANAFTSSELKSCLLLPGTSDDIFSNDAVTRRFVFEGNVLFELFYPAMATNVSLSSKTFTSKKNLCFWVGLSNDNGPDGSGQDISKLPSDTQTVCRKNIAGYHKLDDNKLDDVLAIILQKYQSEIRVYASANKSDFSEEHLTAAAIKLVNLENRFRACETLQPIDSMTKELMRGIREDLQASIKKFPTKRDSPKFNIPKPIKGRAVQ